MRRLATSVALVCALTTFGASVSGGAGGAVPHRAALPTRAQLSAAWWQWALGSPVHDPAYTGPVSNPLFDTTGAACNVKQSGPVFYLAGVFNVSGTATRTCAIPAGKTLFFPLLNYENDNLCVPTQTVDQLRAGAAKAIDAVRKLHATVDGVAVPNLWNDRVKSPVFSYTLPPNDNVAQQFGCNMSGVVHPVVSDGYWVELPPLPNGRHVINFGGTQGDPATFTLDITYNLTVG